MTDKQREYLRLKQENAKPAYSALMKHYPFGLDDLDGEVWREIEGYNGDYLVSNFGRVKRFYKHRQSRTLKPIFDNSGYLRVTLWKNSKGKNILVHRLAALAFIPNPENKPHVNHIDGVKFNNYVSNLEWVTRSENQRHAVKLGLIQSGEEHYNAKLTTAQVLYIRENPDGLTGRELAKRFNVNATQISYIQTGKRYKVAGGTVRKAKPCKQSPRVPDDIRAKIKAEYVYGSKEFGSYALARKYGVDSSTILSIVKEV